MSGMTARPNPDEITVIKRNVAGEETWRYTGRVLQRNDHSALIEALFNRTDSLFEGIYLKNGDRFVEIYFNDRWYNIFTIFDRDGGEIKAWYCNVTRPAVISETAIEYIDLALDLIVFPDGRRKVLDIDEFEQLDLDDETSRAAWQALRDLETLFEVIPAGIMPDGLLDSPGTEIGGGNFPTTS